MITSLPPSKTNWVFRFTKKKRKEGTDLFKVVRVNPFCKKCGALKREKSCKHTIPPHYHDVSRYADMEQMVEEDDKDFMREVR